MDAKIIGFFYFHNFRPEKSAPELNLFSKKHPEALRNASGSPSLKGFSDIWASAENISHWDIRLAGGVLIAKPGNRAMIYAATTLDNGRR